MTIRPLFHLRPGVISVSIPAGVVTDDPHYSGSTAVNAFAGVNYQFTVAAPPAPPLPRTFLGIGVSPGAGCSYTMTHPWYTCDASECTLFVRPSGTACGSGASRQMKKVTMQTLRRIGELGFERNGGDGRDTILHYGAGEEWPSGVVSQLSSG